MANDTVMKTKGKLFLVLILTLTAQWAFAQSRSIGLRLGDPAGITYKKYLDFYKSKAVEFTLGGASPEWHKRYYLNTFEELSKYSGYGYQSHSIESTIYLQARYLFHYDIPMTGAEGKLDWYWGAGGMLKVAKIRYRYRSEDASPPNQVDIHTDVDLGPEGILGLEYTFQDIPLVVFGEGSMLIELADRPFTWRPFGALGLRYLFK
jgi:hypothetical protein